jgi:formylglycine-generating enzyme required for sulfatase activity/mono/diheme cytochrome c family protein
MPRDSHAPPDREQAVQDAVLDYLRAVDAGRAPDPGEFLARYPDLAGELGDFFADQARLGPLVAPLRDLARGGPPPAPADDPPAPAAGVPGIPGYEVLGPLGGGGMGVVYRARQVRLDRVVAVKMIRARRLPCPADQARFHAEARAVARLDHPNIVRVYDSGERDGVPYLVLEFVAGGTLADRLADGPWPPAAAARLLVQLADAIDYAHRSGVVHRDLKPANVLLTPGGVPKIADFGLSKQLQAAGGLTHAGDVLGTPAYMAPEQAAGQTDAVGPGTDVFGLGAILYALLTARPPFRGDTLSEVLRAAKAGRTPPPRQLNGRVPPALERICLTALAADPRQRYPSAAALARDLRRYLARPRRRAWGAVALAGVLAAATPVWLPGLTGPAGSGEPIPVVTEADPPDPPPPTPPTVPAAPSPAELAGRAEGVLRAHCYRCHGEGGSVEGGFNSVLDRPQLVARKRVVPGRPDASRLVRRVEDGEMPPDGESPRPGPDDVAVLRAWVAAGAPEFRPPPPPRAFVSAEDVLRLIRDDLEKARETDRPFYRYFTLTHLANAGLSEDGLETYRRGLSKLVNSLSWHRDITVPVPIDPGRTVARIDLRDYRWGEREWELILAAYPYGVVPPTPLAEQTAALTRCRLPHVRADWFVFAASRPPLYHQVLQLPGTDRALEADLVRVDVAGDVRQFLAARAGFNGSGVATGNRLIERHKSDYGAYWKSYDFAPPDGPDGGRKNLFRHPLGPGPGPNAFRHDGGEIIFSLPNGLQGYMLVNAAGRRIDEGPTSLVKDPRSRTAAVVNGISCMSCHVRGMIAKDDQILAHVESNQGAFTRDEVAAVRALYPPREAFAALLREDADRFARAVARATEAPPGTTDPVVALAARYEWDLDAALAAAEVGLPTAAFLDGLNRSDALARVMGQLRSEGGTVQRQVYADQFKDLVRVLQRGTVYEPAAAAPPAAARPAPDPGVLTNGIGMRLRRVEPGTFRMGSPPDEPGRGPDEEPRAVRIDRAFLIGVTEVTRGQYAAVTGRAAGPGGDDLPVADVSREEALEFCRRLSDRPEERRAGRAYRLPTEAEWEYACRAGSTTAFSFPGGAEELGDYAWHAGNSGGQPRPVGLRKPNAWGLSDMHGNVAEWCADRYDPGNSTMFILRGGAFWDGAVRARCAARHSSLAHFRGPAYGFRVVLTAE